MFPTLKYISNVSWAADSWPENSSDYGETNSFASQD